jgi:transposase
MADLFLVSRVQMRRIERYFPRSYGIARVDDRRIVSAIVFVIKNGLRWRDAPRDYGPHKTIYNRFVRSSRLRVLCRADVAPSNFPVGIRENRRRLATSDGDAPSHGPRNRVNLPRF